ncbi:MAG: FmdB family zinc ribbon protein [Bradyrhizobium sp.]
MTTSYFDKILYDFKCESPVCGQKFQEILGRLLQANEVVCPKCGVAVDIRESKRTGDIGKAFDTANQLDKQGPQEN